MIRDRAAWHVASSTTSLPSVSHPAHCIITIHNLPKGITSESKSLSESNVTPPSRIPQSFRLAHCHELWIRLNLSDEFWDTLPQTTLRVPDDQPDDGLSSGIGPSLSKADYATLNMDYSDIYSCVPMPR